MNERIKELAEQAGMTNTLGCFWQSGDYDLERFAELVAADAVAKEREECAKLVERMSDSTWTFCNFAEAIRARSKHE